MPDKNEDTQDSGGGIDIVWTSTILILVFSPITALAAALTYYASAAHKIRVAGIFQAVLAPLLLILTLFFVPAAELLVKSFTITLPAIIGDAGFSVENYILFVLQQAPFAVPLGVAVGMVYCLHKWKNQPKWKKSEFRRTPLELLKARQVRRDIEQDKNTPKDGMTLGVDERGRRVIQTYEEAAKHTLVFGTVGSGKTTTLVARLRDSIKSGQGAVIIDLKGGEDLPAAAYELAARYGRKFQHWTMQSADSAYTGPSPLGPAYYDPIARGDATRRTNLIIDMKKWSDDHYRIQSESFLQLAFSVMIANRNKNLTPLADIISLLDAHSLHERSIPLAGNPEYADIVRAANKLVDTKPGKGNKNEHVEDLHAILNTILLGTGGRYLLDDPDKQRNNNINLFQSAHNGDVVVFSLDSSNYGQMSSNMANLIVQDLKTVSSELRRQPLDKPFQVIIDEFAAIGSDNVIGFANKSRDAKLPVTLATQTLADLKQNNANTLDQLAGLVASFIVHRTNIYSDVEFLAGLTGRVERTRINESIQMTQGLVEGGSAAGYGTMQSYEDYAISPTEIQGLGTGEMIYIHRPAQKVLRVQCIRENLTAKQKAEFQEEIEAREARELERLRLVQDQQGVQFDAPPAENSVPLTPPVRGDRKPDFSALFEDEDEQPMEEAEKKPALVAPARTIDRTQNLDAMARIMGKTKEEAESLLGDKKTSISVSPTPPSKATPLPVIKRPQPLPAKLPTLPAVPKLPAAPALPTRPPVTPKVQQKPSLPITEGEQKDEFDF